MAKTNEPLQSSAALGSAGDVTYLRTRGSKTARLRTPRNQPQSQRQVDTQQINTLVMREYSKLSPAECLAWSDYAKRIQKTDTLLQPYIPTASNAFCSLNFFLIDTGSTFLYTPPTIQNPFILPSITLQNTITQGSISVNGQVNYVSNPNCLIEISISCGFTSGNRLPRIPDYRHYSYELVLIEHPFSLIVSGLTDGKWYYVRCRTIDQYGQVTAWTESHIKVEQLTNYYHFSGSLTGDTSHFGDYGAIINISDHNTSVIVDIVHLINSQSSWQSINLPIGYYDISPHFDDSYYDNITPTSYLNQHLDHNIDLLNLAWNETPQLTPLTGVFLGDTSQLADKNASILIYDAADTTLLETVTLSNHQTYWQTVSGYPDGTYNVHTVCDSPSYFSPASYLLEVLDWPNNPIPVDSLDFTFTVPPPTATLSGALSGEVDVLGTNNCKIRIFDSETDDLLETIVLVNNQETWQSSPYESGTYDVRADKGSMNSVYPGDYPDQILTAPTDITDLDFDFEI